MGKLRFARPVALNTWVNAGRVKTKLYGVLGQTRANFWDDAHTWLDENGRGRSFVDVGTMWGDQWGAFDAEERGAKPVTALDITPPTDECRLEQERRGSNVRFVTGDLHDPGTLEEVGLHDVVLCSGVLYHCPSPLLTLECLRSITRGHLLLATKTIQEVPGVPQACIFYPGLTESQRLAIGAGIGGLAIGLHTPFDPAERYANFWWGISRSALHGMLLSTGWDVVQQKDYRMRLGFLSFLIAQPSHATASTSVSGYASSTA
jgi:hypothetical protein